MRDSARAERVKRYNLQDSVSSFRETRGYFLPCVKECPSVSPRAVKACVTVCESSHTIVGVSTQRSHTPRTRWNRTVWYCIALAMFAGIWIIKQRRGGRGGRRENSDKQETDAILRIPIIRDALGRVSSTRRGCRKRHSIIPARWVNCNNWSYRRISLMQHGISSRIIYDIRTIAAASVCQSDDRDWRYASPLLRDVGTY